MTDPRIAWFAMGATFGLVLRGWPWHLRFSRYSRMQDPDWRRSISHENTNRPSGPPPLKLRRGQRGEQQERAHHAEAGHRADPTHRRRCCD